MYCQSCGGENPDEARFCMSCGTAIAAPGDKGGLIVDDTDKGMRTLREVEPAPSSPDEDSKTSKAEAEAGEKRADGASAASTASVENTLAGLRTRSSNTLTSVSLSLASISLRAPTKAGLIMVLLGLGLVGIGAATMYAVMAVYARNVAVIATTNTPIPSSRPPIKLNGGTGGGEDGQFISSGPVVADLGSGKVSGGAQGGSGGSDVPSKSSGGGADKAPGAAAKSKSPASADEIRRSSSTKVEAPPGDEGSTAPSEPSTPTGGSDTPSPPGFDEGGGERDIEMDMYAGHVRRVIRQFYAARAQSCFDRATRNNHNLRGTVVVRFTVGGDGNVASSSPVRNTTGDDDLGQCLAGQVRSWRLPQPPDDQPVDLEMPFSW